MLTRIMIAFYAVIMINATVYGHEISKADVPSVVWNKFNNAYPKAIDVEWKLKGALYKVEFEVGLWGTDHEIWYDQTGKMLKHKEEGNTNQVPPVVVHSLNNCFGKYLIFDVDKITTPNSVTFKLTIKSYGKKWEVVVNDQGNILHKQLD